MTTLNFLANITFNQINNEGVDTNNVESLSKLFASPEEANNYALSLVNEDIRPTSTKWNYTSLSAQIEDISNMEEDITAPEVIIEEFIIVAKHW